MFDRVRRAWRAFWERRTSLSRADFLTAASAAIRSLAGVVVSESTALALPAAWACTRVLAETPATLPLGIYRRRADGGRELVPEHPLTDIVSIAPNPEMTWVNYLEAMQAHAVNYGNAYSEIQINGAGRPMALWPLLPDRTWPDRDPRTKAIFYRTTIPKTNKQELLPRERVLHVAGLGFDGLVGYSVIAKARESLGLGLAAQEFGARFFGNGMNIGATFEHPDKLGDEAYGRLKEQLATKTGLSHAHRTMILEEGMKVGKKYGLAPNEAQFLETRQFQVPEVCRWYRVPPHAIHDLSRAHYNNVEEEARALVIYTFMPWLVRWEKALAWQLLTPAERRAGLYFKFNVAALLRGDTATRYAAYAIGRQWGWLSADDVRELEDMNPLPDGKGQTYLNPLNMVPAGQEGRPQARALAKALYLALEERSDDNA